MWSADRAGFPDCKTTQPRLRGALYVWFTSNTSSQQLGHSFVEPKFVFRFLLRFQKCSCFTAYLGHDEQTNSLKLKAGLVFGDCLHNHREPCEFASGVCHCKAVSRGRGSGRPTFSAFFFFFFVGSLKQRKRTKIDVMIHSSHNECL